MSLTPEERQRIYEEEKARIEAQQQITAEAQHKTEASNAQALTSGQQMLLVIVVIFMLGSCMWFVDQIRTQPTTSTSVSSSSIIDSSSYTASSVPPPAADPAQTEALREQTEMIQEQTEKLKVTVQKGWEFTDEENYDYIRGSVKNNSSRAVSYWKVTAHYFDRKGNIVDTAYTNALETLPPGAAKRFEIMHNTLASVKTANVHVEEVNFAQ